MLPKNLKFISKQNKYNYKRYKPQDGLRTLKEFASLILASAGREVLNLFSLLLQRLYTLSILDTECSRSCEVILSLLTSARKYKRLLLYFSRSTSAINSNTFQQIDWFLGQDMMYNKVKLSQIAFANLRAIYTLCILPNL